MRVAVYGLMPLGSGEVVVRIGAIEIVPLLDGAWRFPVPALYDRAASEWTAHPSLFDRGMVVTQLGGFLVRTRDRTVLVDAGRGANAEPGNDLLANLAEAGVQRDDVTDVILTHLHFDHVGWVSDGEHRTFPNATYRCDEADWTFFMGPEAHDESAALAMLGGLPARVRLPPIAARLVTWSGDANVAPGIDVRAAPGHTPGSAIVVVSSGEERALLLGDVVHCPIELVDADWHYLHDVDPVLARTTRDRLAAELAGSGVPAAGAHFPGLKFGRLIEARAGCRWTFS